MTLEQKRIARGLHEHLRSLSQGILSGNGDGFDEAMNELRTVDHRVRSNVDEFYTSSLATNMHKNRFAEVPANETTRVRLQPLTELDNCPYINANYIDGRELFGVPFTYLATQAPLQNTILDFWQMVYENKVVFIIMLCAELESGKVKSEVYWPKEGKEIDLAFLRIVSVSETRVFDLIFRSLLLRTPRGEERHVKHIQYIGWPDQGIPDSSAPLMEIIQTMGKSESSIQAPILVHCSGGIGRTGVFIALHVALAQFQMEKKDIDVKHIVHTLKLTRSGMVQRKDQFLFLCYAVLREMDRMILSAEKGVDLLGMRHRERVSKRSAPTGSQMTPPGSSFPQLEPTALPQNRHQQQYELPAYITRHVVRGTPEVGSFPLPPHRRTCLSQAEQHLLETYLRQQRTPIRQVAANRQSPRNIIDKITATKPERVRNDNGNTIKGIPAGGEAIALEEQLKEWQVRNKKMRFSTNMREKEPIQNGEGSTQHAQSICSDITGSRIQISTTTQSVARERDRDQEEEQHIFLPHNDVASSDFINPPVSISITPQEATARNSCSLIHTDTNDTPSSPSKNTSSECRQPQQEQKKHVSWTSSQTNFEGSTGKKQCTETALRVDKLRAATADFSTPTLFKRDTPRHNAITEEELQRL